MGVIIIVPQVAKLSKLVQITPVIHYMVLVGNISIVNGDYKPRNIGRDL